MHIDELDKSEPRRLEQMLALEPSVGQVWQPEELAAIFKHQLQVQLEFDLGDVSSDLAGFGAPGGVGTLRWGVTFADLLQHPLPSLALLERAKRFAKACKNEPCAALPAEVATVLYFACIIVARLRHGARITALDDMSLSGGLKWAIAHPWIDAATRRLLEEGIEQLTQQST